MTDDKLLCLLFGHKWGKAHEVGCSGEWDSECVRCGQSSGCMDSNENGEEPRWLIWQRLWRKWLHLVLCKVGWHVWHDWWGVGSPTMCAWCWKERPEVRR